jgi:hypothetical protein
MKCLTESISKMNRSTGNDIGYTPFIDLIWVQPERRGQLWLNSSGFEVRRVESDHSSCSDA